ncbi:MAG: flagellar basal body P-ring formation chaperone FlgA [Phycisphaerae bacterium]
MFATTRLAKLSLIAAAGIILPAFTSTAAYQNTGVEIRLWTEATVTDPQIKLSQIASIRGDETSIAAIRNLTLTSDLNVSRKINLRASQIADRLGEAGFNVSQIAITGAANCVINYEPSSQTKKMDETGTSLDLAVKQAAPASLEARLREIICQNLETKALPKEHEVKINFNSALRDVLAMTDPAYQFEINPQRTSTWLGLVAFKVKIWRNGQVLQTLPIMADVRVRLPLLIAAKTINSKARIGKSDVEKNWREVGNVNGKFMTDIGDVLDQQAKKMIQTGSVITGDLLESVPLVRRGQLITVVYQKGGLEIKTVGKSMQNGYKNEIIQVRNERSKELFHARVTGEGRVCVQENLAGGRNNS